MTNPGDNRPLLFEVAQSEPTDQSKVYGYEAVTVVMEQLDPIFVYQAERNTTKIGERIQITMQVETPGYEDDMVVWFPNSQVSLQEGPCSVLVNGIEKECLALEGNTIKMRNVPGNHTYIFKGLNNSQFSEKPAETDKIAIHMGEQFQNA